MDPTIRIKLWSLCTKNNLNSPYIIPFGKEPSQIDLLKIFPTPLNKFFLELGCGWGEVILQLAEENPEIGFIGIERKWDRLKIIEKSIRKKNLTNLLLSSVDFQIFLSDIFPPNSFDTILMKFPDPWPKRKHHKKRAIDSHFLSTIYSLLKPNGKFYFATDHGGYFRRTLSHLRKLPQLKYSNQEWSKEGFLFPISEFEKRKLKEGKRIYYLERFK